MTTSALRPGLTPTTYSYPINPSPKNIIEQFPPYSPQTNERQPPPQPPKQNGAIYSLFAL